MNIPAELVDIANTCDMHGLRPEADMLTEIARSLMSPGKEAQPANDNDPNREMPWEKAMRERPDAPWYNQGVDGDDQTDFMGR
jgi:hypothetical protein